MQNKFQVNLGGILALLSEHIYSSPKVYLRELLQNATDAITAKTCKTDGKICIELYETGTNKMLVVEDNGIGLSHEDIMQFLSVIGESSKRVSFDAMDEDFIGRFGIGLLSCFIVSDEITIMTKKGESGKSYKWVGKNDGTYTIAEVEDIGNCGTTVYLKSNDKSREFFDYTYIKETLIYYGLFLPYDIEFTYDQLSQRINSSYRPWGGELIQNRYDMLNIGENLFNETFLDYIPVRDKNFDGLIYIVSDKIVITDRSRGKIYARGMFVTENSEKLMPKWGFFLKPLLNCKNLRLTASREDFFENDDLLDVQDIISDSVKKYINSLAKYDTDRLKQLVSIHYEALKQLSLTDDELYCLIINYIPFETTMGELTLIDICRDNGCLKYVKTVDEFKQIQTIAKAQDICVINGGYVFNTTLIERFGLIVPTAEIIHTRPEDVFGNFHDIDPSESTATNKFLAIAENVLKGKNCSISLKLFMPEETSSIYAISDEARLFQNLLDMSQDKDIYAEISSFLLEKTEISPCVLCFNYNNYLIRKLVHSISGIADNTVVKRAIEILYVLAIQNSGHIVSKENSGLLTSGLDFLLKLALKNAGEGEC